jgi:hypothetical protein
VVKEDGNSNVTDSNEEQSAKHNGPIRSTDAGTLMLDNGRP